jgi:hypothetical protein
VAAAKPDLTITKVSAATSVVRGSTLAVSDTVRNAGRGRAKAAQVAYLLSKDAKRGKGDEALNGRRSVKALAPGKAAKGSRTVTVPATLAIGTYRLIACADRTAGPASTTGRGGCAPSTSRSTSRP